MRRRLSMIILFLLAGCRSSTPLHESTPPRSLAVATDATTQADHTTWTAQRDDWYSLTLAGDHAGWMRIAREDDGRRYRTVTEMTLEFHRNGMDLDVASFVEWTESHDGRAQHLKIARKNKDKLANGGIESASVWEKTREGDPLGLLSIKNEWEFGGDKVTKIGTQDGKLIRASLGTLSGPWLTPVATERFIGGQIAQNTREFEYGALDASDSLRKLSIHCTLIGPSDFAFNGTIIPVTVWRTQNSLNSGETISHYSRDGKLMYSSLDTGMGLLETRLCLKNEALELAQPTTAPQVDHPPVKPDRVLTGTSRAVFEVRLKEGKLPRLPSAGAQSVEMSEDGRSARISVDAAQTSAATAAELAEIQAREAAAVEGPEDRFILELAAQSIREAEGLGTLELARSSRAVVHRRFADRAGGSPISALAAGEMQVHDAGIEQARTLCAVLRVHKISSRMVSGLAYRPSPGGNGAFEWRLWSHALMDGRWVDLDPAGADQFNGGHILTGLSGIGVADADPDPAGFAKILSQVEIKIAAQE